MDISDLQERFSHTREEKIKAVFASLFILQNRLHTAFDKGNPKITLKQFMLLIMIRQAGGPLSLTELGTLLGCSRQNIKKLGDSLVRKGFVTASHPEGDGRALAYAPSQGLHVFFDQAAESHRKALALLFADYSDGEIDTFFTVLMKLYDGADRIQETGLQKG